MSRVRFSPLAEDDLQSILEFIARDKPRAAGEFVSRLRERCQLLAQFPEMGERRPAFATGEFRVFSVGSYVIYYRPLQDGVEVVRVVHGARDFG